MLAVGVAVAVTVGRAVAVVVTVGHLKTLRTFLACLRPLHYLCALETMAEILIPAWLASKLYQVMQPVALI